MTIRQTIARWLSPETIERADRYSDLLATIEHHRRWLSEFSEIAATLDRLVDGGTPDIAKFREQLRAQQMRRIVLARRGMAADLAWHETSTEPRP